MATTMNRLNNVCNLLQYLCLVKIFQFPIEFLIKMLRILIETIRSLSIDIS